MKIYHHNMLAVTMHWLAFYAAIHGAIWIAGLRMSKRGALVLAVGFAFALLMQLRRILSIGRAESELRASLQDESAGLPFGIETKRAPFFPGYLFVVLLLLFVLGLATRLIR